MKRLMVAGYVILALVSMYVFVAWSRFRIVHPKAGDGALYVHFTEVMTFREVPELQEKGE